MLDGRGRVGADHPDDHASTAWRTITGNFTQQPGAATWPCSCATARSRCSSTPQSIQTVSATLGKDSLRAGLLAGGIGLALVLIYMIVYYRALGLVVVLGLGVSGALLYSIITQLSQTSGLALSLAGVTGIIVSVGVTVDSYIVYFERLKDEIRAGKTVRSSVDRSFSRAYRTIVAADLVSLHGGRHPVPVHRRLGPGLRLLPRAVDPARPDHGLLLHPADGRCCSAATGSSPRPASSAWPAAWPPTPTGGAA